MRLAGKQLPAREDVPQPMTRHLLALFVLVLVPFSTGCIHRSPGTLHESPSEPLTVAQLRLRDELRRDVEELSVDIGPRNAAESVSTVLAAENWLIDRLEAYGIEPRRDEVDINVSTVANIEASFPGKTRPNEIVLIGAHYDTVAGSPGANDNASGVALLLATAKRLVAEPTDRTVRIVFFVNEESPFNSGIQMGSNVYAKRSRAGDDAIVLMIAVDSIGYYMNEKGSQNRPPLVGQLLPSRGNFVAFLSDRENRGLLDRVVAVFQEQSRFPSIGVASDSKQLNRSDHAPFLWQGYAAILMSDTSEGRDPHYHSPTDTAGNLDYDQMARMADGFVETVRVLASGSMQLP